MYSRYIIKKAMQRRRLMRKRADLAMAGVLGLGGSGVAALTLNRLAERSTRPGESEEDKRKRVQRATVLGAALGALTGVGSSAFMPDLVTPPEPKSWFDGKGYTLGLGGLGAMLPYLTGAGGSKAPALRVPKTKIKFVPIRLVASALTAWLGGRVGAAIDSASE